VSRTFFIVWIGQLVSLIGTNLTLFAVGLWVFRQTGSVTDFALLSVATALPGILVSPFAGVLIDRWDRRRAMMLADAGAGVCMLALVALLATGRVSLPVLYLLFCVSSTFMAFQWPAYSAATTLLVDKANLARASGMAQSAAAVANIAAPLLGGLLIEVVPLQTLVACDVATYAVALATLAAVRFPAPPRGEGRASMWREAASAWSYIAARPGLAALLWLFTVTNFAVAFAQVLITPLLLGLGGTRALGVTLSVGAIGMLLGGVLASVWGGPARRVLGVLGFQVAVAALLAVMGVAPSIYVAGAALFGLFFVVPLVIACNNAIWQLKTDPALQGRVFAVRRMLTWGSMPVAYLLCGPLASAIGVGHVFVLVAVVSAMATATAASTSRVRLVEEQLPDVVP
jgi:MFS family permease